MGGFYGILPEKRSLAEILTQRAERVRFSLFLAPARIAQATKATFAATVVHSVSVNQCMLALRAALHAGSYSAGQPVGSQISAPNAK